jgi:nitronate monooxygenase
MQALTEAKAAEGAGADTIVAQGMDARGHRGAFDATKAEQQVVGLFAIVAAIVDAVQIPVMATESHYHQGEMAMLRDLMRMLVLF